MKTVVWLQMTSSVQMDTPSYFDMDNEFVKQVRDMSSIFKN